MHYSMYCHTYNYIPTKYTPFCCTLLVMHLIIGGIPDSSCFKSCYDTIINIVGYADATCYFTSENNLGYINTEEALRFIDFSRNNSQHLLSMDFTGATYISKSTDKLLVLVI